MVASLRARGPLLHPAACLRPGCSSATEGREGLSRSQYSIFNLPVHCVCLRRGLQAASGGIESGTPQMPGCLVAEPTSQEIATRRASRPHLNLFNVCIIRSGFKTKVASLMQQTGTQFAFPTCRVHSLTKYTAIDVSWEAWEAIMML